MLYIFITLTVSQPYYGEWCSQSAGKLSCWRTYFHRSFFKFHRNDLFRQGSTKAERQARKLQFPIWRQFWRDPELIVALRLGKRTLYQLYCPDRLVYLWHRFYRKDHLSNIPNYIVYLSWINGRVSNHPWPHHPPPTSRPRVIVNREAVILPLFFRENIFDHIHV